MKKLLSILMIFIAAVTFAADKTTAVFTLDHQMHQGCKVKITKNLRYEKGIKSIDVSLPKNTITIVYDSEKTNPEKIIAGFKKIGFNAMLLQQDKTETAAPKDKKPGK